MAIESWSRDIALVSLAQGLENYAELQKVVEMIHQKGGCHVVIDFSGVAIVGSRIFACLLELRQLVQESGHKLVLCGLSPAIKGVFSIARLDSVFEFVDDRFAALAEVQMIG